MIIIYRLVYDSEIIYRPAERSGMEVNVPMNELIRLIEVLLETIDHPKQIQDESTVWCMVEEGQWDTPMTDRQFTATVVASTIVGSFLEGKGITGEVKLQAMMRILYDMQAAAASNPDLMPTFQEFMSQ